MSEYDRMSSCKNHTISFRSDYKNWHRCRYHDIPMNCDKCQDYEQIPDEEPISNEERLIRMAEAISKIAFSLEILTKTVQTIQDMVIGLRLEVRQNDVPIINIKEPVCAKEEYEPTFKFTNCDTCVHIVKNENGSANCTKLNTLMTFARPSYCDKYEEKE